MRGENKHSTRYAAKVESIHRRWRIKRFSKSYLYFFFIHSGLKAYVSWTKVSQEKIDFVKDPADSEPTGTSFNTHKALSYIWTSGGEKAK